MKNQPISKKKREFFEKYSEFSDFEKEMLYKQTLANEKLEKIKANTSFYTWLIIVSLLVSLIVVISEGNL
jgi:hypothetical protein